MIELSLRGLRAGYGAVEVLHGVDLDVPAAAVTAVVGPNGAGKTTLLTAVAGLVPVRGGRVSWRGRHIDRVPPHRLAHAGLTLVPERNAVFAGLTVAENLATFAGGGATDRSVRLFPELADRLTQRAGTLSGGEQRMLAITRAVLGRPRLLLLDEPTFGLSRQVSHRVLALVRDLATDGIAVVLVEPTPRAAASVADVVYVLGHGVVTFAGEPSELGPALPGVRSPGSRTAGR